MCAEDVVTLKIELQNGQLETQQESVLAEQMKSEQSSCELLCQ